MLWKLGSEPPGSRFLNTCLLLLFGHKLAAVSIHKGESLLLFEGRAGKTL